VLDKPKDISGLIVSRGSTRLNPLLIAWATAFQKYYKDIEVDIQAIGSSSAPPALIADEVNIAAMSRPMKQKERNDFKQEKGYFPLEISVSLDAIAIYVNRRNPLNHITLEQVESIFSSTQTCGNDLDIHLWRDLGWQRGGDILLFGHHNKAGAYSYFRKKVLCGGEYKAGIKEHITQDELLHTVSINRTGIGYSSIRLSRFYGTKPLAISRAPYFPAYMPSEKNIAAGTYPLSRHLYLYLDQPPKQSLPLLLKEFIKFILSNEGQRIVHQTGAVPLLPHLIGLELLKMN